jgi:glycosyltransferase involved in cell wall biosynthesis
MPRALSNEDRGPLVSVIIPTLNEESSLPVSLQAVAEQTYLDLEVLVVDSGSKDRTQEIARQHGASVVSYPGRLMGARRRGFQESKGTFILFLDGDQVLYPDTVGRAVKAMAEMDMLILEETSYRPKGWLQRSLCRQKAAMHAAADPVTGTGPNLYPRFFRRELLARAYEGLDEDKLAKVFTYEDGLLFRRAYAVSHRIGLLSQGVMHMEEEGWLALMRHSYKAGKSARSVDIIELEGDIGQGESRGSQLVRAIRGRYVMLSLVKELSFKLGHLTGR